MDLGLPATVYAFQTHPSHMTAGEKSFSPLQNVHTRYGPHPASYLMRTMVLSQGQSGRSVKLTTSSSAEGKKEQSCTSTSLTRLHAWIETGLPFTHAHRLPS